MAGLSARAPGISLCFTFALLGLACAAPSAGGPRFSTLFTAQDVVQYLGDAGAVQAAVAWASGMGLSKVYLESFRDNMTAPGDLLRGARDAFRAAGFQVSGCVCTTGNGRSSTNFTQVSNYAVRETQEKTAQIFHYTAQIFDEIIIDDFFFTDDESPASVAIRDSRRVPVFATPFSPEPKNESYEVSPDASCIGEDRCAWSYQRRAMMKAVSERDVLAAARAANPNVTVILKFPNWYDHYQDHGYDVGAQADLFPEIWVGTETRDYMASGPGCEWATSVPVTMGQFILRWHSSARNGASRPLGSWYDALCTSPESYVEQARQAVLAGSPEQFLFHFGDIARTPTGKAAAQALKAAMPELMSVFAELGAASAVPVGISAYKPINSHGGCKMGEAAPRDKPCDGEGQVFDFVSALGMPLVPTHVYPPVGDAVPTAAFFSVHALKDPKLPSILQGALAAGTELLVTNGLVAKLPSDVAKRLQAAETARVLNVSGDPMAMLANPPARLVSVRNALLERLGWRLAAPSAWVAFQPYASGAWALMNLRSEPMSVRVTDTIRGREWNKTVAGRGWAAFNRAGDQITMD